jgi:hypothetical protein
MAVAVVETKRGVPGDTRELFANVTFDSTYPAGGEPLTAAQLGFPGGTILHLNATTTGGYMPVYNYATSKLQLFGQTAATGALVETTTTDQSATVVRVYARIGNV